MLTFLQILLFTAVFVIQPVLTTPISNLTITNGNSSKIIVQGWTSSPNVRGTIDIIWSCIVTIFLCSWSVLCLQIPAKKDNRFVILWRRAWLTALCALGPEFTLQLALGQWSSARQSVKDFGHADIPGWTMKHAFYADSGGFFLHTPDFKPIPIDAKQLLYLIKCKYIEFPSLTEQEVDDKNKVDVLLRMISIGQIIWFIVTIIARAVQGLFITGMELTTAAFILCSFGSTYCWWNKGADVAVPQPLYTNTTMAQILIDGGDAALAPYHRTPLDFVSREEWHWSLYWTHWINILRKLHINFAPQTLPHDRLENTVWLDLTSRGSMSAFIIITLAYVGIFLSGWNDYFPTRVEKILWRVSSLLMMGAIVLYFVVTWSVYYAYPAMKRYFHTRRMSSKEIRKVKDKSPESPSENEKHPIEKPGPVSNLERLSGKSYRDRSRFATIAAGLRNNSVLKDASLDVPLKATIPIYGVAFLYCCSRTYILVEDMIQLRSLPVSAYTTVNWNTFFPHLG